MYGEQVLNGLQTTSGVDAPNSSPVYGNAGAIWLDFFEYVRGRATTDFGNYLVQIDPVTAPPGLQLSAPTLSDSGGKSK